MYTPREWPHPSISQSNTPQSPPGGGGQLRRAAQARQDWLSRLHLSQPTLSHLAFPSPLTRVHHHHPTTSQPQNEPSHADFHEYLVSQGKTSFLHRPNQPHPFKVARLHRRLPPDGIFKGGRETPIDSQPHPSDWNTAFREALDEEGRPLKDDDGDLLYRDRAGNSVRVSLSRSCPTPSRNIADSESIPRFLTSRTSPVHRSAVTPSERPLQRYATDTRARSHLSLHQRNLHSLSSFLPHFDIS